MSSASPGTSAGTESTSAELVLSPLAIVNGEQFTQAPQDLYIPPDALAIILETFEGPLDLLLYLIKRQNLDILQLNVAAITDQYMQYVEMMDALQFELAAEYLVMAAMLAQIKSRMLLPRMEEAEAEEDDPRAELIRRLQEYERFKEAAENLDQLPREGRDFVTATAKEPEFKRERPQPQVHMKDIMVALAEVIRRAELNEHHQIEFEAVSTREKMSTLLDLVKNQPFVPFLAVLRAEEGRLGVIVSFLAMMELLKESLIDIVQAEPFGPIHIKAREAA